VFAHAGRRFDLSSTGELRRVLFRKLALCGEEEPAPDPSPLPPRVRGQGPAPDPLESLGDRHPILRPLREYRRLDAEAPTFASTAEFERIRSGQRPLPRIRIRPRIASAPAEG
jgi:DNA polymerase I-like protein with 3'-5' exonuclease and polymerase domains